MLLYATVVAATLCCVHKELLDYRCQCKNIVLHVIRKQKMGGGEGEEERELQYRYT